MSTPTRRESEDVLAAAFAPADWQLPPGVRRSLWEYAHSAEIAEDYDGYFSENSLFRFDLEVLNRHLAEPGVLVDLGCGPGRLLIPFARRGFHCIGIDLSADMLRLARHRAEAEGLAVRTVQANLVELDRVDELRENCADYCICMFSTIAMIDGHENRQRVLAEARRLLKPGGRFAVHVHNVWNLLFDPQARKWLMRNWLRARLGRCEFGDRVATYRGIPRMLLHFYSGRELRRCLRQEGFRIVEWIPLAAQRCEPLGHRWFLGGLRANGWIVVCE